MAASASARAFLALAPCINFATACGWSSLADGIRASAASTRPPGKTNLPGMKACSSCRRPSSTFGAGPLRSRMISVAASFGRMAGCVGVIFPSAFNRSTVSGMGVYRRSFLPRDADLGSRFLSRRERRPSCSARGRWRLSIFPLESSSKRSAPATGAASTSRTLTASPSR